DVVILHDHIAKVYADPGLHPLGWRAAGVGDRLSVLHRLRTAHRVDHAVELAEHGVTRRVDDTPLMRLDEPPGAVVEFADQRGGALFVLPHHAAEAGNVDHDDSRELAARHRGFRRHAKTIINLFARLD